jgi:membrane fusion protein (multidrug efflux system)
MPQKKSKTVFEKPLTEIPQAIPPVIPPQKENGDEEPIETVPLYKNVKVVIPLFVVVLAISIFAWMYYIQLRDYVSTDDAYIDADRVSVSAKILGRIDELAAGEGDSVQQGQILVRLDDSDLRAQETQAKASLAFARENVLLARVNLEKSEADYKRASTQFHQNIIPKEQYDNAQSELASSRARLNIARAQVVSAQSQLGVIQTQLNNTIIASPMTGVISKRWVLTGDVVQPGQSVFTIYNIKDVWVTANLEETALGALRLGDTVDIKVDTYPHMKFGGTILRLGSNTASQFSLIPPNNASGNFTKVTQRVPIKISIEQFSGTHPTPVKLLPGMSVEVKVKVH